MPERPCDSESKRRCRIQKMYIYIYNIQIESNTKVVGLATGTSIVTLWSCETCHGQPGARPESGAAQRLGFSNSVILYQLSGRMRNQMIHIDFWILMYTQFVYCRYFDIFWWQLVLMNTLLPLKALLNTSYRSHSKESEPFQICFEIWGFLLSHLQRGQSGPIHCYFSCMVPGNDPWTRHGAKGFNAFERL